MFVVFETDFAQREFMTINAGAKDPLVAELEEETGLKMKPREADNPQNIIWENLPFKKSKFWWRKKLILWALGAGLVLFLYKILILRRYGLHLQDKFPSLECKEVRANFLEKDLQQLAGFYWLDRNDSGVKYYSAVCPVHQE